MSPLTDDQMKNTITLNMDFSGLDTVGDNISTVFRHVNAVKLYNMPLGFFSIFDAMCP